MNKAESKTLFRLKLLSTSIIFIIIFTLVYFSKNKFTQSSASIKKFPEQATTQIKLLNKKYKSTELVIAQEPYILNLKKKISYINYWAIWCEPCKEEIPALLNLKKQMPHIDFIFVNIDEKEKINEAQNFWQSLDTQTQMIQVNSNKVFSYTMGVPYHQFFDNNNFFVAHSVGDITDMSELINFLNELAQVK